MRRYTMNVLRVAVIFAVASSVATAQLLSAIGDGSSCNCNEDNMITIRPDLYDYAPDATAEAWYSARYDPDTFSVYFDVHNVRSFTNGHVIVGRVDARELAEDALTPKVAAFSYDMLWRPNTNCTSGPIDIPHPSMVATIGYNSPGNCTRTVSVRYSLVDRALQSPMCSMSETASTTTVRCEVTLSSIRPYDFSEAFALIVHESLFVGTVMFPRQLGLTQAPINISPMAGVQATCEQLDETVVQCEVPGIWNFQQGLTVTTHPGLDWIDEASCAISTSLSSGKTTLRCNRDADGVDLSAGQEVTANVTSTLSGDIPAEFVWRLTYVQKVSVSIGQRIREFIQSIIPPINRIRFRRWQRLYFRIDCDTQTFWLKELFYSNQRGVGYALREWSEFSVRIWKFRRFYVVSFVASVEPDRSDSRYNGRADQWQADLDARREFYEDAPFQLKTTVWRSDDANADDDDRRQSSELIDFDPSSVDEVPVVIGFNNYTALEPQGAGAVLDNITMDGLRAESPVAVAAGPGISIATPPEGVATTPTTAESDGGSPLLIVIVVAAAIVVLGAVIAGYMFMKKSDKKAPQPQKGGKQQHAADQDDDKASLDSSAFGETVSFAVKPKKKRGDDDDDDDERKADEDQYNDDDNRPLAHGAAAVPFPHDEVDDANFKSCRAPEDRGASFVAAKGGPDQHSDDAPPTVVSTSGREAKKAADDGGAPLLVSHGGDEEEDDRLQNDSERIEVKSVDETDDASSESRLPPPLRGPAPVGVPDNNSNATGDVAAPGTSAMFTSCLGTTAAAAMQSPSYKEPSPRRVSVVFNADDFKAVSDDDASPQRKAFLQRRSSAMFHSCLEADPLADDGRPSSVDTSLRRYRDYDDDDSKANAEASSPPAADAGRRRGSVTPTPMKAAAAQLQRRRGAALPAAEVDATPARDASAGPVELPTPSPRPDPSSAEQADVAPTAAAAAAAPAAPEVDTLPSPDEREAWSSSRVTPARDNATPSPPPPPQTQSHTQDHPTATMTPPKIDLERADDVVVSTNAAAAVNDNDAQTTPAAPTLGAALAVPAKRGAHERAISDTSTFGDDDSSVVNPPQRVPTPEATPEAVAAAEDGEAASKKSPSTTPPPPAAPAPEDAVAAAEEEDDAEEVHEDCR